MNFFKKLQHHSFLNCPLESVLKFEQQLAVVLSGLPTAGNHDRIRELITNLNRKETGLFTSNFELWNSITRSDVEVNKLSFDYFNGYASRLSAILKQNNIKINKSKILHNIAKVIGLTGSQSLKQRQLIKPEFILFKFNQDAQQDVIEIITYNSVIIDVQVSGFDTFCGCNAKLDIDDDTKLMLYTPKHDKYILPNPAMPVTSSFNRGTFKYRVESQETVNSDYILGFMSIINGGVDSVDRAKYEDEQYIQYKYGVHVALANLKKIDAQ